MIHSFENSNTEDTSNDLGHPCLLIAESIDKIKLVEHINILKN